MKQSEFNNVFSQKFAGFTSRMWLDYCDEHNNPFAKAQLYAKQKLGYEVKIVLSNSVGRNLFRKF